MSTHNSRSCHHPSFLCRCFSLYRIHLLRLASSELWHHHHTKDPFLGLERSGRLQGLYRTQSTHLGVYSHIQCHQMVPKAASLPSASSGSYSQYPTQEILMNFIAFLTSSRSKSSMLSEANSFLCLSMTTCLGGLPGMGMKGSMTY